MAKILIVEDEDCMILVYKWVLQERGDELSFYSSGREVLSALEQEGGIFYDLAISDRSLKDISGDIVVDRLKQACPERPIIKVSGYDDPCPEGLRPADRFLRKPFHPHELTDMVEELLKNTQPAISQSF